MALDNEIAKELANQTPGILDRAYDDAVHPSAVSIGDTASLIPRTVGVLPGRWKVWVVNGERNIDLAINQVAEKLEDVPEERLCEPAPNIVARQSSSSPTRTTARSTASWSSPATSPCTSTT